MGTELRSSVFLNTLPTETSRHQLTTPGIFFSLNLASSHLLWDDTTVLTFCEMMPQFITCCSHTGLSEALFICFLSVVKIGKLVVFQTWESPLHPSIQSSSLKSLLTGLPCLANVPILFFWLSFVLFQICEKTKGRQLLSPWPVTIPSQIISASPASWYLQILLFHSVINANSS